MHASLFTFAVAIGQAIAHSLDYGHSSGGLVARNIPRPRANDGWGDLKVGRRSVDGRCGTGFGTTCEEGECCSSAGYCGVGYLYCSGPSCQIDYGPFCDANVRPNGANTESVPRPHIGPVPYGQGVYHCEEYGDIALTYDDGPFVYTHDLLDLLARYNAKATFFVTGRNLGKGAINDPSEPWADLIHRMIEEGHQVASHTWTHERLTTLSEQKFHNQMLFNEIALNDILGFFPTYMRPPYSASNSTVDAWLGDLGYHVTYFNLDTEGYLHDDPNFIQQSKDIWDVNVEGKNPVTTKWLAIEHDPNYQSVYNLTEHMLKSLFANGFKSVTVGECLKDPPENWYRTPGAPPPDPTTTASPGPSMPPTTDGRCGPGHNDATCRFEPGATCCSSHGWCGATSDHCGTGCQVGFGTCSSSTGGPPAEPTTKTTTTATTTKTTTTSQGPSKPPSTDGRCGPLHNDATCQFEPGATCCSSHGWCGATSDHCGTGCQVGFGTCSSSPVGPPAEPTTSKTTTTTTTTTASTGPSKPASKDGRCGSGHNNATCQFEPGATCCSQYGWCGATTGHCGTGCQVGFGTCSSSS